jgi:hypothetical protein
MCSGFQMSEEEMRGFVFHTSDGEKELTIEEVKDLADHGDPDGLYALGMAYLFGWDILQDERIGYDFLEQASEKGQTEAMTLLVRMYMKGEYDGLDPEKAAGMAIRAAKDGISDAQMYAGLAYMDGVGVVQDYSEAVRLFRLAANQGNDEARTDLAFLFQEGLGVQKDEPKAFALYRTAARNGNLNAMFHLAVCYEFGVGTEKDLSKAAEWFRKGSDIGDPFSSERLAYLVSEGYGDKGPDAEGAFELFLKAANAGVPGAMFMVGYCYLGGHGTASDVDEAMRWLRMAAESDIQDAKELLAEIE